MRLVTNTNGDQRISEPYRDAAGIYWDSGWTAPIPLPPARKYPPPNGYTGAAGVAPSRADVQAWIDGPEGDGNIALRLPGDVLGIDVDAYGAKGGSNTFIAAAARWGQLPATWRSTSRDDAFSGIYLYRIPDGLQWPGQLGADVELIQAHHRYAVVSPSVHPEGRTYRWITPAGLPSTVPPRPEQLADLPEAWIVGLTHGRAHEDAPRNNLAPGQAGAWLTEHDPGRPACRATTHTLTAALAELAGPGSAHETVRNATIRLVALAAHGHHGATTALTQLRAAFLADVTAPGRDNRRDQPTAEHEWASQLIGAVNKISANSPPAPPADPCDNPFAGLLPPEDRPVATGTAALPHAEPLPPATPTPDQDTAERTSWWPRDLARVLSGHDDDPTAQPAFLARADGQQLFYPGRINGLLGASESGKSWLAIEATRQALAAGHTVHYFDFEDSPIGLVGRLRTIGIPDDHLQRFAYIGPEEALTAAAAADLTETLRAQPDLIILDGFNAAMTLLGLELESNSDATRFAQLLLKPLAATGAAVVTVDHLPKNKENRGPGGIGAQAKRAMASGCLITVEVLTPPAPGQTGKLHLTVDKDRPGAVRGASTGARNVGTAVLTSDPGTGDLSITIETPERSVNDAGKFRPTTLMQHVSDFLATMPGEWVTRRSIEAEVRGRGTAVRDACDRLVEEGFAERRPGDRGAVLHRHLKAFNPETDTLTHLVDSPRLDGGRLVDEDGDLVNTATGVIYDDEAQPWGRR